MAAETGQPIGDTSPALELVSLRQTVFHLLATLRSVRRLVAMTALLAMASLDLWLHRPRTSAEGAARIHVWCGRLVRAIGITLKVTGTAPRTGAVVSNHLSYLDILLYSAVSPFVMVSKVEVHSWPLLGWFTAQAGTVYVERGGNPSTYPAVNRAMSKAYRTGLPVLFFPEGTTTDGSVILPFRRGLFHSVLDNHAALRTASLRYTLPAGNGDATVGNDVCWWGDAYLGPHLFRCLGLKGLQAEIAFDKHEIEGCDRFALSENAHDAVSALYEGYERPSVHAQAGAGPAGATASAPARPTSPARPSLQP